MWLSRRISFTRWKFYLIILISILLTHHLTILFRDLTPRSPKNFVFFFADVLPFRNQLSTSVESISRHFPQVPIHIVSQKALYPHPTLNQSNNVFFHSNEIFLSHNLLHADLRFIEAEYFVFLPDGIIMKSPHLFSEALRRASNAPSKVHGFPLGHRNESKCVNVLVDVKKWTVIFSNVGNVSCTSLTGNNVLILHKSLMNLLPTPFSSPFPQTFFIQTAAKHVNVQLHIDLAFEETSSFATQHNIWKVKKFQEEQLASFCTKHGIKKIQKSDGTVSWFGCRRETPRCFTTVYNDTPEFLISGRWTPPCCLENLRKVFHRVIKVLESNDCRYWLEGGTLLGAARNGDVIPWDYDGDVGIYLEDVSKVTYLVKASRGTPTVDEQGFLWEKALEGSFYRVHFSPVNRMHVDIFPFQPSKSGVMLRGTWNTGHPQDQDFSEHYLRPTVPIPFVGISARAPNNYRSFLETKFGPGAIEHPQLPNS